MNRNNKSQNSGGYFQFVSNLAKNYSDRAVITMCWLKFKFYKKAT